MRRFRAWIMRIAGMFARTRHERELADELESHLQMHIDDNLRSGLSPEEARRAALLTLGGLVQTKEAVRDARATFVDSILQDVTFALRLMRRSPVVTMVAVLSLALGIGANTAIFSVLNSLILRPLPVREPQRLMLLDVSNPGEGRFFSNWSNPVWEEIRSRPQLFDGAFAWAWVPFSQVQGEASETVQGIWASGRFLDVLGVPAVLGRTLTEADDRRGGGPEGPVAVISYGFWQRRFAGAADVIGRPLTLERVSCTIVGVTPPGFFGPDVGRRFDVVLPLGVEPVVRGQESWFDRRNFRWLGIMARLAPDQTAEAAVAALRALQPRIRDATRPERGRPEDLENYLRSPFTLRPGTAGRSTARARFQRPLLTLMAIVSVLLLLACANIANLLLARVMMRRHELSVRRALGASQLRLARQFLTESLLLSAMGTAIGLLLAIGTSRLLVQAQSIGGSAPLYLDLPVDWRVLGFTVAVLMSTAVLFGTAPALRGARVQPREALTDGGHRVRGERRLGLSHGLVIGQVALSLVLVVAAGLFLQTLLALVAVDLGFDRDAVLVADVAVQRSSAIPAERAALFDRVRLAAASVPGVSHAAVSLMTPLDGASSADVVAAIDGKPVPAVDREVATNYVSPDWFATFGTPILAGRDFSDRDRPGAPRVAIVNEAFSRRFLRGSSPLGSTVRLASDAGDLPAIEIVGLSRDAVYGSLRDPLQPTIYLPIAQTSNAPWWSVSVRAARGRPALLSPSLATAIHQAHPDLTPTFRTLTDQVDGSIGQERLMAILAACFGGLALLMAGLGLFGVTSYAVSRRRAEIGIRMALGADASGVVRMILRRVAALVGIGIAIGGVASIWAAHFVESLLFGMTPHDPTAFATAAAILAVVGLLAGWLPARRAARINPTTVLRES